jgi:hypothetical protein
VTELRFTEVLRYSIPGGVFLLTAAWTTYPCIAHLAAGKDVTQVAFLAAASLLIGSAIQLVHRAFVVSSFLPSPPCAARRETTDARQGLALLYPFGS